MNATTQTPPQTLKSRLLDAIGQESFSRHREWWEEQLRVHPDVIQQALEAIATRRDRGERTLDNPGGWMFSTVRNKIGGTR